MTRSPRSHRRTIPSETLELGVAPRERERTARNVGDPDAAPVLIRPDGTTDRRVLGSDRADRGTAVVRCERSRAGSTPESRIETAYWPGPAGTNPRNVRPEPSIVRSNGSVPPQSVARDRAPVTPAPSTRTPARRHARGVAPVVTDRATDRSRATIAGGRPGQRRRRPTRHRICGRPATARWFLTGAVSPRTVERPPSCPRSQSPIPRSPPLSGSLPGTWP